MSDIAVIWRSDAITHGPFAVLRSLDEEAKRELQAYLVALDGAEPAAYDMLNPYYGGGYLAVEPDDYAGLDVLTAHNVDAVRLPAAPVDIPAPAQPE
jgi:ABC-type phosphate/phosphonate transport system substrate-binding protein